MSSSSSSNSGEDSMNSSRSNSPVHSQGSHFLDQHSTGDDDPYFSHNDIDSDDSQDSSSDSTEDENLSDELPELKRITIYYDVFIVVVFLLNYYSKLYCLATSPLPNSQELGKLVVDYLISEGYREVLLIVYSIKNKDIGLYILCYFQAAELLCNEAGLELPKNDIKNLDARMSIRNAIIEGRLDDAIREVSELCPTLLEENREVRFHLMQQNLIEMIRRGDMEASLQYAQTNLSSDKLLTDTQLERLEKTFALLAFEKPEESPFGKLLEQAQRQMVSTEVNGAVLRALNRPAAPRLEALLRMMVWAQKQLTTERDEERGITGEKDTNIIARTLFGGTTF
uniref:CTLH domain-containing protein n=1 Tax=Heterorhabditis bacteriophora TaxID=37862 RepID=A0A1I7XIG7_HETBA